MGRAWAQERYEQQNYVSRWEIPYGSIKLPLGHCWDRSLWHAVLSWQPSCIAFSRIPRLLGPRGGKSPRLCNVTVAIVVVSSLVPRSKSPRGERSGDIGMVSWLYRRVTKPQCYAINHTPVVHCYAMEYKNCRVAFWLAWAKPRQLTLYNVATQQDAKSHENHRAAIWLAYAKTRLLSLQKPRERSTVTRPFSSQRVRSGDETMSYPDFSTS